MRVSLKRNTLDLSVVLATHDEAPNLYRLLPLLAETLDELGVSWEVIVVAPDSGDGTRKVAEGGGAVYLQEDDIAYGKALLRGVGEAKGTFVLSMDADMSHPANVIPVLWEDRDGADVVIASRYVRGAIAEQPRFRTFYSKLLNRFFASGLSIDAKDMSSGFRLYRKSVFEGLDFQFISSVIQVETLLLAAGQGKLIREVPFHYHPAHTGSSTSRIRQFGKDYLRLFYRVWKMRNSVEFPDYDWRAYDSRIWLQRYWQRTRHKIALRFTPKFVSTCDVGCGSSRILADLPHAIGVDMRHDKLSFMRKTNHLLVQGNGMELPFPDDHFECVICSQVIEHIPEENGRLIDELTRILQPGGTLVIGTPDYGRWEWLVLEWLYGKLAPGAYADEHVTHYTYDSLREALESRGYTDLEHDYVGRGELIFKGCKKK